MKDQRYDRDLVSFLNKGLFDPLTSFGVVSFSPVLAVAAFPPEWPLGKPTISCHLIARYYRYRSACLVEVSMLSSELTHIVCPFFGRLSAVRKDSRNYFPGYLFGFVKSILGRGNAKGYPDWLSKPTVTSGSCRQFTPISVHCQFTRNKIYIKKLGTAVYIVNGKVEKEKGRRRRRSTFPSSQTVYVKYKKRE